MLSYSETQIIAILYLLCLSCIVLVAQSCPTLWNSMDYSPPGSFVHGILQARVLKWVAISFSRGSSWPRDQPCIFCVSYFGSWIYLWSLRIYFAVVQLMLSLFYPVDCSSPASLSLTISQSSTKFMSVELVMPSNHLNLCCPLLLWPLIFPNIRVFSNELALRIRWPKCWEFQLHH